MRILPDFLTQLTDVHDVRDRPASPEGLAELRRVGVTHVYVGHKSEGSILQMTCWPRPRSSWCIATGRRMCFGWWKGSDGVRVLRLCIVGVVVLMLCAPGDSSLASRRDERPGAEPLRMTGANPAVYLPASRSDEGSGAEPLRMTGVNQTVYLPGVFQAYRAPEGRIRLTFGGADEMQPALSPDGDAVAYVRVDGGQSDVYLLSLISGATIRLTNTPGANEETPIFSPDGVWIVFASDRTGDWDIYRVRRDGTGLEAIIAQPGTAEQHPAFMPDGQRLAFSWSATGGGDIYTGEIGSASASWAQLTNHPAADRFPTVTADGGRIAFRSERDGNSEVYLMDADGAHIQRLTTDPGFDGYPAITPDGSGVAFVGARGGANGVYLVNAGGAAVNRIAGEPALEVDTPPRLAGWPVAGLCRTRAGQGLRHLPAAVHEPAGGGRAARRDVAGGSLRMGGRDVGLWVGSCVARDGRYALPGLDAGVDRRLHPAPSDDHARE